MQDCSAFIGLISLPPAKFLRSYADVVCSGERIRHGLVHAARGSVACSFASTSCCGVRTPRRPRPAGNVEEYDPYRRDEALLRKTISALEVGTERGRHHTQHALALVGHGAAEALAGGTRR